MKSLLLKDYYTLLKQTKIFLLIIIIFAVNPNFSMVSFAIIYSAMMPMTALAYDERAKWDVLAAMMPYSVRSIVLSKYVLGYIVIFAATVLSVAAKLVLAIVQRTQANTSELLPVLCITLVATILLSVQLPLLFRFGVEKGRLASVLLIALVMSATYFGINILENPTLHNANYTVVMIIAVGVTAVINIVSIHLSQTLYNRRKI